MKKQVLLNLVIFVGLIACAVLGAVGPAVMGQTEAGPIDYGPTIITNQDRLFACYSLARQMIDEFNRQGDMAKSDPGRYGAKFVSYRDEVFEPKLKVLLAERNRLMEKIRWANYSGGEWHELSIEDERYIEVCEALFGVRHDEEVKPTLATADVLDELKAVVLDDVTPGEFMDPTEDLTTYTEVDPATYIAVTTDRVTVDDLDRDIDAYLYDDFGAGHFDDDYEHLLQGKVTASSGTAFWFIHMLANSIDDYRGIADANGDALACYFRWAATPRIYIIELDGGAQYTDAYTPPSLNTMYYFTVERDEAVGTYGSMYCYIYSDASRETLVDTLSVALHTSKKDFRYFYVTNTLNDGTPDQIIDGYAEYYDLQEAAPSAVPYSYGYIIGG